MEHLGQFEIIVGSLALSMAVMIGAYVAALKLRFFSLADVAWAYLFAGVAALYTLLPGGWTPRKFLLLGMVTFWSVRLGTRLLTTMKASFPAELSRFANLRTQWALNLRLNFFIFFLFHGLSVLILAVPFLLVALNPYANFSYVEILGMVVWLIGIIGGMRDRRRPEIGRENLFETLIWVGYALLALPAPNGWAAITSPLLVIYLLRKGFLPLPKNT